MRWDSLRLGEAADAAAPALLARGAVTRTFDTPGFGGKTFYEIHARSIINRVPDASRVPFRWTVNPYRGCTHACRYCFARRTHSYLDLDTGHDFDSKIVVKVNAADRLRAELAAPGWRGEHLAMGTNVDCYQRAEGRYQLMRGILTVLRDTANPFSILTKGSLILRDLDLLEAAAEVTEVGAAVSVGFIDDELWRQVEPGTPHPRKRLEVCAALTDRGIGCGVLMAPIMPFLTDSPTALEAAVRQIARAGATGVTPIVLHLRPGAREWFLGWLAGYRPDLVGKYRELYRRGAYAPKHYQEGVCAQVRELAARYGIGAATGDRTRRVPRPSSPESSPARPTLLKASSPQRSVSAAPVPYRPSAEQLTLPEVG
jgi:DNA repair photolyase